MDFEEISFKFDFQDSYNWRINDLPEKNLVSIASTDYFLGYLNHNQSGKKGGNSYVFALYDAQEYDEIAEPAHVIKISKWAFTQKNRNRKFENEIAALSQCKLQKHQHVISFDDIYGLCCFKERDYPFYIMEYAEEDLRSFLKDNVLTIPQKLELCLHIANGLKELYDLGFYHRDLKPDNIFMVEGVWKIGDLGLMSSREMDSLEDIQSIIGPKGWLSPEAMNKYLIEDRRNEYGYDLRINHQSDIFQLGKLFWFIMQGNVPIGGIKPIDFKVKDTQIYDLLKRMLNHGKKRRPQNIQEVIETLYKINRKYY